MILPLIRKVVPASARKKVFFRPRNIARYVQALGVLPGCAAYAQLYRTGNKVAQVKVPHLPHPLAMRPWTADVAVFEQVFVQQEYDISLPFEPRWIIDAGAHIGMASVYFANRYPKAKIVAIECNPDNYAILVRNTQPYENITPIHAALWHTPGQVSIENPDDLSWAFRVSDSGESTGTKAIPVRAITVPEALEAIHGERIDVLKMDIEGAEYGVLVDLASPSWLDETQAAILELHDRIQPGCTEVAKRAFPAKNFRELSHGEHVAYIRCQI